MSSHQNSSSAASTGGDTTSGCIITAGTASTVGSTVVTIPASTTSSTVSSTVDTIPESTSAAGFTVSTSTVGGTSTSIANTSGCANSLRSDSNVHRDTSGSANDSDLVPDTSGSVNPLHSDSNGDSDSDSDSDTSGSLIPPRSDSDVDSDSDSDSDSDDGISLKKRSNFNVHSLVLADDPLKATVRSLLGSNLDPAEKLKIMNIVSHNLSVGSFETIDIVLQEGVLPLLISLSAKYNQLQALAVCCLSNIATGTSKQTRELVKNKAVPVLIKLMRSSFIIIKKLAIYALGNIAAGDGVCRSAIFKSNGIIPLLNVLNDGDERYFTTVNWVLVNIFRKKVPSVLILTGWVQGLIITVLKPLILRYLSPDDDLGNRSEDDRTVANTSLQMLRCFLHTPCFYSLIETDTYQHVPKYLSCYHLGLTFKALEIIKHVPDSFKKVLIDNQVLTKLKLLIETDNPSILLLREVYEAILLFTVDEPDYSQDVIGEEHLILHVIAVLNDNEKPDPAIKLSAAKIIFNVTCGGLEQTMLLPLDMCIEELCGLFLDNDDVKLLELSLGAIQNFLLYGQTDHNIKTIADLIDNYDGAVDRLNALMTTDDSNICKLAEDILDKLDLE